MSSRTIYLLVDIPPSQSAKDESLYGFIYNYLINPIVNKKSNKIQFKKFPNSNDNVHTSFEWPSIISFLEELRTVPSTEDYNPDTLIDEILNILNPLPFLTGKRKLTDVIVVSDLKGRYTWEVNGPKISSVLKQCPYVNISFIDSFSINNENCFPDLKENHDFNINYITENIIHSNTENTQNYVYPLEKMNLVSFQNCIPKFKKPVDIYSGNINFLDIPDLDFKVSAYPFVKRNSLSDFVTTSVIDRNSKEKIKAIYTKYYENDEDEEIILNDTDEHLKTVYRYGASKIFYPELLNINKDERNMKFFEKSMIITGFVPLDSVPVWHLKNDSLIVLPSKDSAKSKENFNMTEKSLAIYNELFYSMKRLKVGALIRLIKRDGSENIKYGLLIPQNFVDEFTEFNGGGQVDFNCFIFIETIFRDDEKVVNLPNLSIIEADEDIEEEFDKLIDDLCLDNDANDSVYESNTISMNDIPVDDMFYYIRDNTASKKPANPILANTITAAIREHQNPLMAFERLIYHLSYEIVMQHLKNGGDTSCSLYEMYSQQGKSYVNSEIEAWLEIIKASFKPLKEDLQLQG